MTRLDSAVSDMYAVTLTDSVELPAVTAEEVSLASTAYPVK